MDAWTFIWLMVLLKIPIVALFLIVRWAVREVPESTQDGGIGPRSAPHPHHPRPHLPRHPRRGPHGGSQICSPPRTRSVVLRVRSVSH
ncbi:MAG: hypothetical protein ACRDK2_09355 [Solirubrobacteraceae bacterium]